LATKWKSSIAIGIWSLFMTFALSGIISLLTSGSHYFYRDYFHTMEFQDELSQFAGYLSLFELNEQTPEKAKAAITVSKDEIDQYRYQKGPLENQIQSIKDQYESLINQAENKDAYKKDRDQKIEELTKNFNNDDYIIEKVKQEKEQMIDDFFKQKDSFRSEFLKYQDAFVYDFKSPTGKTYTKGKMDGGNLMFVRNYAISRDALLSLPIGDYSGIDQFLVGKESENVEGKIGVPKSSNFLMDEYKQYEFHQIIFIIYTVASIVFLIVCFFLAKNAKLVMEEMEKWRPFYNKLPIDLRALLFMITGMGTLLCLLILSEQVRNLNENPVVLVEDFLISIVLGAIFCAHAFVQGKFFVTEFKDLASVKQQWNHAMINKAGKLTMSLFHRAKLNVEEVFMKQNTSRQLLILFLIVFGLGLAGTIMAVHPVFILLYMILLAAVGIPTMMVLTKRLGYFNQIVGKIHELAAGDHGEDLPVSGHSELATLAGNINLLKHGVIQSQSEQAKSERLKTELITNVSHDLRTPLTSIITYTELLKRQELSNDDKTAYLEIIDRKSKRLKVLIDDLFEISKMASGSMELNKEKVDINQLLEQALAEYDVNESSLQFRVTKPDDPVYVLVDGQKIWRVFDNLIGNILKYSLENTRVYISVTPLKGQVNITFKNVSKYELSEQADELYERFKRGDTSRNTEGSGLGLAIVKSIIDLHGGTMNIETDGDLFKVVILLKMEQSTH
jgi:signal transduction histidine kinase